MAGEELVVADEEKCRERRAARFVTDDAVEESIGRGGDGDTTADGPEVCRECRDVRKCGRRRGDEEEEENEKEAAGGGGGAMAMAELDLVGGASVAAAPAAAVRRQRQEAVEEDKTRRGTVRAADTRDMGIGRMDEKRSQGRYS